MRIYKPLLIAFSLSLTLPGCQKTAEQEMKPVDEQEISNPVTVVPLTFGATTEAATATKTSLDGLTPVWDEADRISIICADGTNCCFTASTVSGGTAEFQGEASSEGPYCAVYPYASDNALSGSSVVAVIPAEQTIGEGYVAKGALVAVAYAATSSDNLQFRNVTSILKLSLASDDITSITLTSNDGSALAGKVTVDPATGTIASVSEGTPVIRILPEDGVFPEGDMYIAIIPGSKEGGITLTLTRTLDKRKAEKTSTNALSVVRNGAKSLGSLEGSKLEWLYLIDNFADFKDYAADSDNWYEDGETVYLRADIDMEMEAWKPITDTYDGCFEGGGHCLYNINLVSSSYQHLGVFGQYYKDVRNLTFGSKDGKTYDGASKIENSYNTSNSKWTYTAPITFSNGTIENVTNFMPVTVKKVCGNKSRTSGISAWTEKDGVEIINCTNYADITLGASAGSDSNVNLAGILSGINSSNVTIKGCTNYGKIRSSSIYTKGIAGIVGLNYTASQNCLVEDCVNYGEIELRYTNTQNEFICIGGIMGRSNCKAGAEPFRINNCVNYGSIIASGVHQQGVGGIVGRGDGVAITNCVNEGPVTIDHSEHATARWQAMGGILGIGSDGYGTNSVDNCINRGKLTMIVLSCGRVSTSETSKFYGVTCGGIIGCAAQVSSITGNRNYGSIDVTNKYEAKNTETMRATAYVGGILGFDYAEVPVFADNVNGKDVVISAKTTYASASYAEVRAGGIFGSMENSTMASGRSSGTVVATNANASAKAYAGSIGGYNGGAISYCAYAGTVNGAAATTANIVGNGNQPVASDVAGDDSSDTHGGGLDDLNPETGVWD